MGGGRLLYAFPFGISWGDIDRKESLLSDDAELSGIINESRQNKCLFYYNKVRSAN